MELNTTFIENEMELDGDFGQVFEVSKSAFDGGAIQVCCACQTMITESTGKTIETKKSRINAGKPVVGQYALYSNGIALVESVADNGDFTATVMAYNRITINGEVSTTKTIYAPTTFGTAGQMLVSNGQNKAPTWIDVPESGGGLVEGVGEIQFCCLVNKAVHPGSYAIGRTKTEVLTNVIGSPVIGQHIKYVNCIGEITNVTSTNVEYVVKSVWGTGLNAGFLSPASIFYAPTTAGTSGYVLTSTGKSGEPPVWKAPSASGGSAEARMYTLNVYMYEVADTVETLDVTFNLFGNYTGEEIYDIQTLFSATLNNVGSNNYIPAIGTFNGHSVYAITVRRNGEMRIYYDNDEFAFYVDEDFVQDAYVSCYSQSLFKMFDDTKNWTEEDREW